MSVIDLNNAEKLILFVLEECQSSKSTGEVISLIRDLAGDEKRFKTVGEKLKLDPRERTSLEFYLISSCLHRLERLDLLKIYEDRSMPRQVKRMWLCTRDGRAEIRNRYLAGNKS